MSKKRKANILLIGPVKLTAKQRLILDELSKGERYKSARAQYVWSLHGANVDRNSYVWGQASLREALSDVKAKLGFAKATNDELAKRGRGVFMHLASESKNTRLGHRPPTGIGLGQYVGIEIECVIPMSDSREDCDECGGNGCHVEFDDNGDEIDRVTCGECHGSGYVGRSEDRESVRDALSSEIRASGVRRVTIKDDASIREREGYASFEITHLFNAKYGFESVKTLCDILGDFGAKVNASCGLHVHIDMRDRDRKQVTRIADKLVRTLPVLKFMVPESRRSNSFCRLRKSRDRGERYAAINTTAYRKFRTLEIRLHSGTVNAEKITNWVKLLLWIASEKSRITRTMQSYQDLLDAGLPDSLAQYVEKRIRTLSPEYVFDAQNLSLDGHEYANGSGEIHEPEFERGA